MLTSRRRNQELDLLLGRERPHLDHGLPELDVGLVHFLGRPHLDAQVLPDQGEQRRREVDLALLVERHVHPDQLLVRQPVGTLRPEPQGRVHVLQHVVHLGVMNSSAENQNKYQIRRKTREINHFYLRRARVVLRPDPQELVQVVRPQDGAVPGQVVEVVHDDGDEQVEHEERAEEDEGDEVGVGQVGSARLDLSHVDGLRHGEVHLRLQRLGVARPSGLAGEHDTRPGLTRGAPTFSRKKSNPEKTRETAKYLFIMCLILFLGALNTGIHSKVDIY